MGSEAQQSERKDILTGALAVFGLLFVLYLLTFNGRFTSIDELAIYARAESLIQQGSLDTPQLAFSSYHNVVGEIEIGYAVLAAPLYWLAQQAGRFNNGTGSHEVSGFWEEKTRQLEVPRDTCPLLLQFSLRKRC